MREDDGLEVIDDELLPLSYRSLEECSKLALRLWVACHLSVRLGGAHTDGGLDDEEPFAEECGRHRERCEPFATTCDQHGAGLDEEGAVAAQLSRQRL